MNRTTYAIGTHKNLYGRGPETPRIKRSTGKAPAQSAKRKK